MSRLARRLKAVEAVAHAPVTPMVSAAEFDELAGRVRVLEAELLSARLTRLEDKLSGRKTA